MNTDLSSLARTLAERLLADFSKPSANSMRYPHQLKIAEAVIREAIEKTLKEAEQAILPELEGTNAYAHFEAVKRAIRSLRPR